MAVDIPPSSTKKQETISLSWKTFVVGGFVGYLFAMMTVTVSHNAHLIEFDKLKSSLLGESDEESEEELDETTMRVTILCIILLLICLTIAFELMKEHLEESVNMSIKPILASLFGELTVLGFLSIFTFCVTKLGFMHHLSRVIFGDGEEEENILLETFEEVHYMLFFIMVSFIFIIILVVKESASLENSWFKMNVICANSATDDEDEVSIREEIRDELINRTNTYGKTLMPSFSSYLFRSIFPRFDPREDVYTDYTNEIRYNFTMEDLYLFSELRKEFILERDVDDPPFSPDPNPTVSDNFNFGRYLIICLGNTLGHAVHLHYFTWAFFALLTLIYSGISMVLRDVEFFSWIWVGSAWLCFLVNTYIDHHMLQILYKMIPEIPNAKTVVSSSTNGFHESDTLFSSTSLGSASSPSLPAWTKIHLSESEEANYLTRQDTLYWRGKNGPKWYSIIFQIKLLFISGYMSLLFVKVYPNILGDSTLSTVSKLFYIIASIIPLVLLFRNFPQLVSQLTMISSIGVHRRPQTISQVVRMEKTDRLLQSMLIMQKLQNLSAKNKCSNRQVRTSMVSRCQSLDRSQKSNASRIFHNFDKDGDGVIYTSELQNIFQRLGQAMTPESLNVVISYMDWDNDGTITKDEFAMFYSEHIVGAEMEYKDIDIVAKQLFTQFDLDKSGTITLSEFVEVIEGFNVGFTMDEISELLNGMDGDNTSITEHEFRSLIQSHRHLFDNGLTRKPIALSSL